MSFAQRVLYSSSEVRIKGASRHLEFVGDGLPQRDVPWASVSVQLALVAPLHDVVPRMGGSRPGSGDGRSVRWPMVGMGRDLDRPDEINDNEGQEDAMDGMRNDSQGEGLSAGLRDSRQVHPHNGVRARPRWLCYARLDGPNANHGPQRGGEARPTIGISELHSQ